MELVADGAAREGRAGRGRVARELGLPEGEVALAVGCVDPVDEVAEGLDLGQHFVPAGQGAELLVKDAQEGPVV